MRAAFEVLAWSLVRVVDLHVVILVKSSDAERGHFLVQVGAFANLERLPPLVLNLL